jgi:2-dehydropantoate 2-reductase
VSTHFPEKPRIAIIGAGALGCYYGARLVKAGEDVHFLARSGRAALMVKGLKVKTPTEQVSVRKIQV